MADFKHIDQKIFDSLGSIIQKNLPQPLEAGASFLPITGACLDQEDLLSAIDILLGGWLVGGKIQEEFEQQIATYIGAKSAYLVNSGSSANLLAFATLCSSSLGERSLRPGDEVITVAAGFPTTLNPIIQYGCVPVFLDVSLKTGNIRSDGLEQALSSRTRAIVLAHTLGNPFDLSTIMAFAKKHNLWLIEDNCDALGATYEGKHTGSFGDLSTLSFYPAHHITTGEGGAVLVNNPHLKRIVERLRNWGRDCWCRPGEDNACGNRFRQKHGEMPEGYDHKYIYTEIGYNLKMTDMQAAIGLSQLNKIEAFTAARRRNHQYMLDLMQPMQEFFILPEATPRSDPSWFGFLLSIRHPSIRRQDLLEHLNNRKIGTRLLFGGNLIKQPGYHNMKYRKVSELTGTDAILTSAFWLGVWPGLKQEHINYIAHSIEEFLKLQKLI